MESLARLSDMLETARDLTIEAAQSASAAGRSLRATTSSRQIPAPQLKKLLDSRHDREVLDGLRKVISDCQPFFSSVIKNIASANIEIKKLVYIYLVRYAESEPDLALLSINTIQKSLADQNAQIRALALRVMSAIRVPVISQIVSLAIKRGSGDMSPYVRKAAAMAIPKCYRLDPSELPQLIESLKILLNDKQYYVAGVAVMAYMEVCPDQIDLIHKPYRSLVRKLVDMDEWAQLAMLKMMLIYGRKCFPERGQSKSPKSKKTTDKGFYDDEKDDALDEPDILDPDLDLFLKAARNLLQSRNPAVIIEVAACYLYLAPQKYVEAAIGPVISLLRSPQDIQHVALHNIVALCLRYPDLFVKYSTHFLIKRTDPEFIWRLKLEILVIIFPKCNTHMRSLILTELEHFSRASGDKDLTEQSVRALGRCAQTNEETSSRCLRFLLRQISSTDGVLVSECLTLIRQLIQKDPTQHAETVVRLAANLDKASSPTARASIIWLVGEFAGQDSQAEIAPDVLRVLLKGFADESEEAKMQILLLTAKIYLHYLNKTENGLGPEETGQAAEGDEQGIGEEKKPAAIVLLWDYVLLLVRYDTSFDLRDRARTLKNLLSLPSGTQLATLLLLAQKPVPKTESPFESHKKYTLGSASLIISSSRGGESNAGQGFIGYKAIPERVRAGQEPDPKLREESVEEGTTYSYGEKAASAPAGDALDRALREEMTRRSGNSSIGGNGAGGAPHAAAAGAGLGLGMGGGTAKAREITLDDWLKEDDPVEEEEEEEEEESSESEETDESEDDSEEEEDDEDEAAQASQRLVK